MLYLFRQVFVQALPWWGSNCIDMLPPRDRYSSIFWLNVITSRRGSRTTCDLGRTVSPTVRSQTVWLLKVALRISPVVTLVLLASIDSRRWTLTAWWRRIVVTGKIRHLLVVVSLHAKTEQVTSVPRIYEVDIFFQGAALRGYMIATVAKLSSNCRCPWATGPIHTIFLTVLKRFDSSSLPTTSLLKGHVCLMKMEYRCLESPYSGVVFSAFSLLVIFSENSGPFIVFICGWFLVTALQVLRIMIGGRGLLWLLWGFPFTIGARRCTCRGLWLYKEPVKHVFVVNICSY